MRISIGDETFGTSRARAKRLTAPIPVAAAAVKAGTPAPNAPLLPAAVLTRRPVALNAPAGPAIRIHPFGARGIATRRVSPAARLSCIPGAGPPAPMTRRREGGRVLTTT